MEHTTLPEPLKDILFRYLTSKVDSALKEDPEYMALAHQIQLTPKHLRKERFYDKALEIEKRVEAEVIPRYEALYDHTLKHADAIQDLNATMFPNRFAPLDDYTSSDKN